LKSYRDEPGAPEVIGANRETPVKYLKGIKGCSSKKVTRPTARKKCLYTDAHSMSIKEEELEATMLLESCDLVATTETWWDKSHDWSGAIDGYRLFKRDRQRRRGRGITLYIRKQTECKGLSQKNSHEQVESLWVRIRDQGKKGTLWLVSTTGCSVKGSLLTKPSSSSSRRHQTVRLKSCWGTSTTLISAGKVAQQAVGNPGDSWSALRTTC